MTGTPVPEPFTFDLTQPEPVPETAITRATELMRSGRLFRYAEVGEGQIDDAARLEERMAELLGRRYAVGVNSCGASLFLALRSCGVLPGDRVLVNGYTLAPVPGAIAHAGAEPIVVEITDRLTIDVDDLRAKAASSGARTLLLSHMRGHLADLQHLSTVCEDLGLTLIEDCAHTLGASWGSRPTGTFGRAACFSLQTFKHINSGEGGVLVTDDPDVAARAILYSGSYMNYSQHRARPGLEVFEPLRGTIPNFSLRMTALAAAIAYPQLDLLPARVERMNALYRRLEEAFASIPHVRIIERAAEEHYVGSSFQFALTGLDRERIEAVVRAVTSRGLHVKWYGEERMQGFTSRPAQWEYVRSAADVPRTEAILATVCDLRVPPAMTPEHCRQAAAIVRWAVDSTSDTTSDTTGA